MRKRYRVLIGLAILVVLLAVWVMVDLADRSRHSLRDFDAHEVARLETRMWRSYYDHRSARLFMDLVTLLRQQFHLPFWSACDAAYHAARGAVVFQRGHNRDEHLLALPDVLAYYRMIRNHSTEEFDVLAVSEAELEWWIVHRQRAQHPPGDLANALAMEQAALYRQPEAEFGDHAKARADAMLIRDERAAAGGVSEADWARIGELLDQSWESLRQTVRR